MHLTLQDIAPGAAFTEREGFGSYLSNGQTKHLVKKFRIGKC